ncbi:cathepsin O-like [Lycorma delicatula]|uniref:cathepsin O-like n=1 Tax=Lycorma delicatula TaxID=130591 RepID=UPI003F5178DB
MALSWKDCLIRIGLIGLLFLGIPIHIQKPHQTENHLLFQSYMKKFNKSYKKGSDEYEKRYQNFQKSLDTIQELNAKRQNEDSALYGLTAFSDLSRDEFTHHHLRSDLHNRLRKHTDHRITSSMYEHDNYRHHRNHISKRAISVIPDKVDWRDKGVITKVRNQKLCGACWAFSTVETIESMLAIKNGTLLDLSVQEIIDCAENGNFGCDGGDTCGMLSWLTAYKIKVGLESQYPLKLENGVCKRSKVNVGVEVAKNFSCDYLVGAEDKMLLLLANHGPLTVAINALTWQYYLGGVIQYHCSGSITDINHAVQIVGYDKTAPIPHYIIRNSWGTAFGDKGYVYVAMNGNICGVAVEVTALDVL